MGKPSKKAAAVAAAEVPNGKAGKKREAQDEIEKAVSGKKQKPAPPAKAVPPPKKVESSSSEEKYESEPLEEVKVQANKSAKTANQESRDGTGDVSSESDKEPAKKPAAKLPAQIVSNKGKQESSSSDAGSSDSEDELDGGDNKPTAPLKEPAATGSTKEESEGSGTGSDDDSDEEEEEASGGSSESGRDDEEEEETVNAAQPAEKTASAAPSNKRKESSSDASDSDDSSDKEPAKKKQDTAASTAAKVPKKDSSSDEEEYSDDESDEEEPAKTSKNVPKTPVSTQSEAKGSKTLFMGNPPHSAEMEQVQEFFKEAGEVINVRFPVHKNGTRRGFCYVDFASVEAAQKAIEFNGREFMSRPVKLDFAAEKGSYTPQSDKDTGSFQKPAHTSEKQEPKTPLSTQSQAKGSKTLFMGNARYGAELDQVQEFFKEAAEVIDVRFPLCANGTRKSYCYVDFASVEAAQKAIEFNGREFMSRPVRLDFAAEKGSYTPQSGKDTGSFQKPASFSVFIRGFDISLANEQIRNSLQQHFDECGEITRVSIPTDNKTGAIKGIAYMDFKEQDSLSKALKLRGSELDGFELYVDQATPRGENGGGGRSGGRLGGRSGGRHGGGGGENRGGGGRSGGRLGGRSGGRRGGGGSSGSGGKFGGRNSGRGGRGSNRQSAGKRSYWDDH